LLAPAGFLSADAKDEDATARGRNVLLERTRWPNHFHHAGPKLSIELQKGDAVGHLNLLLRMRLMAEPPSTLAIWY
jgi:hypothetical protein